MESLAIVGGGIGGLASAILLSKKGYKVTIYDKAKSPQPVGAGFLLQPPGQAVLHKLGILDKVLEQAVPIVGLQSKTLSGRSLLDLQYSRLKGSPRNGLGVQRSTIYQALLDEALSSSLVNMNWDSNVEECITKGDVVSVVCNETKVDYDLCVLSSGSNSTMANKYFKDRIHRPYGWGCLWTTFELPGTLAPNILHQRCESSKKMMGILPVRKSGEKYEAALYWSMKSADIEKLKRSDFPALKNEIMQFWPDAKNSLEHLGFDDFIAASYNDNWIPKPFKGRIVAIGDISHATSPQLGQGCTMALLDAWSLAKHLSKEDDSLESSLEEWWNTRKYQLSYVRQLSKFLTPLFQSESKLCEVFRDWLMAPVGRLPVFDNVQLKTLASDVLLRGASIELEE
ncbi:NAD(P)/FAD-dependent oxidoreductase [Aliiglaciecola litoralis]|uniref:NAD(P)/FAD-dependent oxidoreductase n=1 Tax=Aliiglaciecola litoralis TaxID=582857 RepID=A0ABN1LN59_9ALTE